MGCTTCGNSNNTGTVSNIDTSALTNCGCTNTCSCPDIDVTNCQDLKNLLEVLDNRNCTNAEHIDTCNTKSVAWYLAKVIENQACLNAKLIDAICNLQNKINNLEKSE